MKRYVSFHERKFYTHMLEILLAIGGEDLRYKWLITDIEAYPFYEGKYDDFMEKNDYLILSSSELLKMLVKYDDFQWIWAVFSAIPEDIDNETILKYDLPYADCNAAIYKDDVAIIQHPLADIEIVAHDATLVLIVAKEDEIAEKFKKIFPMATSNL